MSFYHYKRNINLKGMEAETKKLRIVAISDTHDKHKFIQAKDLPPADIFIHAGDFTKMSRAKEFQKFRKFMTALPYPHKIVVPGNHDFGLETDIEVYKTLAKKFTIREKELVDPLTELNKLREVCSVLIHEPIEVEGVKIFGSPYVPSSHQMGFTYPPFPSERGEQIWATLPKEIDILVTHGPPFGIFDVSKHGNYHTGCKALLQSVKRIQPRLHIFGHIHQNFGNTSINSTHFYNVSYLDEHYNVKNKPVVIELQVPIP